MLGEWDTVVKSDRYAYSRGRIECSHSGTMSQDEYPRCAHTSGTMA